MARPCVSDLCINNRVDDTIFVAEISSGRTMPFTRTLFIAIVERNFFLASHFHIAIWKDTGDRHSE